MRTAILVFPGTNRERDMREAVKIAGAPEPLMVWHRETELPDDLDLVIVPGGFSYGDYLRSGAMAARSPVMRAVNAFAARGGHVLGVCNGFQILTEAGLLPGALMRNRDLRFICKDAHLRVASTASPFTSGYQPDQLIRFPVAHHDGNYTADPATLERLEGDGRVAFRYAGPDGEVSDATCLNGSCNSIAGVLSENRRVLGLMPHPENLVEPLMGGADGLVLFKSVLESLA